MSDPGQSARVKELVDRLKTGDVEHRREAAMELGQLGAVEATPALLAAFDSEGWLVRQAAVQALLMIPSPEAVTGLLQKLRNSDARIRSAAVEAIRGIGTPSIAPLVKLLKDPDPQVVRYAAEMLGDIGSPDASPALEEALGHPDDNTVYQVLISLGKLRDPRAVPRIIPLLTKSLWVQTAALEALSMIGGATVEDEVAKMLKGEIWALPSVLDALSAIGTEKSLAILYEFVVTDQELAQLALKAIARIIGRTGTHLFKERERSNLLKVAALAMSSQDGDIRRAAIYLAGHFRAADFVMPLCDILRRGEQGEEYGCDDDEHREAAAALASIGAPAVKELVSLLPEVDTATRLIAIDALAQIRSPEAARSLEPLLDDDDTEIVRTVAEALGRIGDTRSIDVLFALFDHMDLSVRAAAQSALARFGARVLERLLAMVANPAAEVRTQAASALGALKDPVAIEPLKKLLVDPSNAVKRAAVFALAQINEQHVGSLPLLLLGNQDPDVRCAAAQVLGRLRDKRAVEPLQYLLTEDVSPWVRYEAAQSLGEIGDRRAVPVLVERMADEAPQVRIAALKAVARLSLEDKISDLQRVFSDPDPEVRLALIESLGPRSGFSGAETLVIMGLRDDDWRVRVASFRALARRAGDDPSRLLPHLRPLLADSNDRVRSAAGDFFRSIEGK